MRRAIAALSVFVAACAEPGVVRVVDGREIEGRYISSYAYTLYAIAADQEAHGDYASALETYTSAADEDPESPEIWTKIGAMRCKVGPPAGSADEAFARARSLDPTYAPLFHEEAECALRAGKAEVALEKAMSARALDPSREETCLYVASLLEKVGRAKEAQRELRALTVVRPTSGPAWRALMDTSKRLGDAASAAQAQRRLMDLARPGSDPAATPPSTRSAAPPLSALDTALASDDLERARKLARSARLSPGEVAVRAAALGRYAVAREQAELVLKADPGQTSARIALAVAADLSGDPARLAGALSDLPSLATSIERPSPLAELMFAELLDRRVGAVAARAWLGPRSEATESGDVSRADDALLSRVEARVRAAYRSR